MNIFTSIFEDNSGGLSSIRIAFLLWVLGVLLIWGFCSIDKKALQPIDNSVVTILGILGASKVAQRYGEKAEITPSVTPK